MVTEYEQLLEQMLKERREKVEDLKSKKAKDKDIASLLSEIGFIQVELERYSRGMKLFRTKDRPKVGRWGKPETEGHAAEEVEDLPEHS